MNSEISVDEALEVAGAVGRTVFLPAAQLSPGMVEVHASAASELLPRSVSRCKEFIIWFFEGRVFEVFGD
mgnify:CR=1 FL=1